MVLSESDFIRYSRHLIIPEIGIEGQNKISNSSVLVVGAGGLGSPALLYLASAGVGRIGIVDFDFVDKSNLQRQVIYDEKDIGKNKAVVAKEKLEDLNSSIKVIAYTEKLDSKNALEIIGPYDVVIDGTDNFPTRYLINDACSILSKPFVYGSIFRFDGQVSFFNPVSGPCYRCIFPRPPPVEEVPGCAEGGVLGALPGIIGSIQALEAIKYIVGKGESLLGKLLTVNTFDMSFMTLEIRKDPDCNYCGERRKVKGLIDYEMFCGIKNEKEDFVISPAELYQRIKSGEKIRIIDVRERYETQIYTIDGSENIPFTELIKNLNTFNPNEQIIVYCHTGMKGAKAARLLRSLGFRKVLNLSGGALGWASFIESKNVAE